MARNLTCEKPKGNRTEPSKSWNGIQGLAIQMSGLSFMAPKLSFKNPNGNLTQPAKSWQGTHGLTLQISGLSV